MSFTGSPEFSHWRDSFYDIVVFGGRLWILGGARPEVGKLAPERLAAFVR